MSQGSYSGREISANTYSSKTLSLLPAGFCVCFFVVLPLPRNELPEGEAFSVLFAVVSPVPHTVLGTE